MTFSAAIDSVNARLAAELAVAENQVASAVRLLDEGATVPFIARYRKEATGSLDDGQLRLLEERLGYLRELDERRNAVLASIKEQGKLTAELTAALMAADTKARVEDIYLPYKPKRRTKAMIARENGLEPLADAILADRQAVPADLAAGFVSEAVPEPIRDRLGAALQAGVARGERRLLQVSARLSPEPLHRRLDQRQARLEAVGARLDGVMPRRLERDADRLAALSRALTTLDPGRPKPGFARVEDSDGAWITSAKALEAGQAVKLVFGDGAQQSMVLGEDDDELHGGGGADTMIGGAGMHRRDLRMHAGTMPAPRRSRAPRHPGDGAASRREVRGG